MKRILSTIVVVAAIVGSAFAKTKAKSDFELVRDTEILINIMRSLREDYVDSLDSTDILRDAVRGVSRSLDPYTSYIDEKEMEQFEISTTGKYGGIGAIIRQNGDWVSIVQPYRGAPADKAGLKIGDRIVEIEGESAKGMSVSEVSDRLKGTPGTTLKLKIGSVLDTTDIRKVRFKRERISIPAVQYAGIITGTDSIAYMRHDDFTEGGYELMRDELLRLRNEEGMKALILDYRGNGGGIMQEATKILSLFVPQGSEVLKIKGRQDSIIYRTESKPLFEKMPIVVMIGGSTASAAEIVSGALQDMDRAILVGEQSFGKGLVQSTIPVGFDAFLKLTTARYYIPSGRSIQAIDYSDHGAERVAGKVADSLRKEFKTAAGRSVLDGGGITPDVEVEPQYVSRFAATLYAMGIIEEWGARYYRDNRAELEELFKDEKMLKEWVEDFNVSYRDFLSFSAMVKEREEKIEYESATSRALKSLEKAAKEDRNSELEELLLQVKEQNSLGDDLHANLERYSAEIMQYMTSDVVMRFAYGEGVTLNSLKQDIQLQRAIELLTTEREEYEELLGGFEH